MAKSGKGATSGAIAADDAKTGLKTQGGIIDAFAFARAGHQAEGSVPLARLLRAVEGLPQQHDGASGEVHWQVRGMYGTGLLTGKPLLALHVQANPVLICQRCMEPFTLPIDAEVTLQLVRRESDLDDDDFGGRGGADDEDDEGDDASGIGAAAPEKVLGSARFDVLSQVEDELILNIPYVARHEVCPGAAGQAGKEESEPVKRPSPFAVLEKLKHKD